MDRPRPSLNASNYLAMRKLLIAFVIVFGWTAGAAAGRTSAAGALADAFVDAWNTHDVRALGRLYADDADWVTVGGERHKGRVVVEGALAKEHGSWARTTTLRATDVAVRAIDSEHAIVMFSGESRALRRVGRNHSAATHSSWPQSKMDVGSSLPDRLRLSRRRDEHRSRRSDDVYVRLYDDTALVTSRQVTTGTRRCASLLREGVDGERAFWAVQNRQVSRSQSGLCCDL